MPAKNAHTEGCRRARERQWCCVSRAAAALFARKRQSTSDSNVRVNASEEARTCPASTRGTRASLRAGGKTTRTPRLPPASLAIAGIAVRIRRDTIRVEGPERRELLRARAIGVRVGGAEPLGVRRDRVQRAVHAVAVQPLLVRDRLGFQVGDDDRSRRSHSSCASRVCSRSVDAIATARFRLDHGGFGPWRTSGAREPFERTVAHPAPALAV